MGLLHDIFFGTSPEVPDETGNGHTDGDGQDWQVEEQRRWADRPLDDWGTKRDESKLPGEEQGDQFHDASGNKVRPMVVIERVKANPSSDWKHVEVWATIRNMSMLSVEVTQTNYKGYRGNGHHLRPNESYETRIYSGDTPTSEAYHDANVQCKLDNGDYFQTDHFVRYRYEQTEYGSFYIPEEYKPNSVVKDI